MLHKAATKPTVTKIPFKAEDYFTQESETGTSGEVPEAPEGGHNAPVV